MTTHNSILSVSNCDFSSSLTSTPQTSSSTDSLVATENSIQQLKDTSQDDVSQDVNQEDLITFTMEQEEHWIDATTNECLEEIRDVPTATDQNIDLAMVCDIQRALSRLIGKAPQLIGNCNSTYINKVTYYLTALR